MKYITGLLLLPTLAFAVPTPEKNITQKTFEASVTVKPTTKVVCNGRADCTVSTNSRNVIFVRSEKQREELDFNRRGSFTKENKHVKMKLDY